MQQQQQLQGNAQVGREVRHAMITKISSAIQSAVLNSGRTKEDLQTYTINMESTAWTQSKGNLVSGVIAEGQLLACVRVPGLCDLRSWLAAAA
jgi:hypothetical protein